METPSFTEQPHWKRSVNGVDDASTRASFKVTSNAMRRSCDLCGIRKKKCDGKRPCSRCLGGGRECTYSNRRWPWPRSRQQAAAEEARVSFKRCSMSASPATGLVGMQENVFLSDFFSCIGFLPLTTRSYIRGTMVKLMITPASMRQPGAVLYDGAGVAYLDTTTTKDACGNAMRAMGPSTCIFWCAVALGALAKGFPIESVSSYCQHARGGLSSSSGPMDAERAMAWAIIAYLYLFCGNTDLFQQYMTLSESCMRTSIEQGSSEMLHAGFAEIVHHRTTVKSCCKDVETGEAESRGDQIQAPPCLNEAATESDLYAFVMRSYGIFEQAIYRTASSRTGATICGADSSDVHRHSGGEQVNLPVVGASTEMLDTMKARLKEYSRQFDRLEELVERPSIRAGIGGLIINGALFLRNAAEGDLSGALERIGRCVEVFERFPGLCRFTIGAHAAHIRIIALAAMDGRQAQEVYHKLRAIYSSHRLPGSSPLPPLEGWQGISGCCDDFYCRTMEPLILTVFSNGGVSGIRQENISDGQNNVLPSASVERNNIPVAPFPSNCGAELDLPHGYNASPGVSRPMHREAEWLTRPTLVAASLSPNGETQAVLGADLGGDERVVHGARKSAGKVAQAPEALLGGREICDWSMVADVAGTEERLAAEDWLDVANVLLL